MNCYRDDVKRNRGKSGVTDNANHLPQSCNLEGMTMNIQ